MRDVNLAVSCPIPPLLPFRGGERLAMPQSCFLTGKEKTRRLAGYKEEGQRTVPKEEEEMEESALQ